MIIEINVRITASYHTVPAESPLRRTFFLTDFLSDHISETSEAIAIKFDKVTASGMRMQHVSFLVAFVLNVWPHGHVLQATGQCILSERAFGVETSE